MLRIASLCLLLFPSFLFAQSPARFQVQGRVTNWQGDTVRLFFLDGVSLRQAAKTPVQEDDNGPYFAMGFQHIPPGFYFVGGGMPTNTRQVILGIDSMVFLQGDYQSFYQANIQYSPANEAFNQAVQISNQLQQQSNQLNRQFQGLNNSGQDTEAVAEQLRTLDQQKLALMDSLSLIHPMLAKAMALKTYLVSPEIQAEYDTEIDFFADTYFSQADLSDSVYQHMPFVHEAFQTYASTLGSIKLPLEQVLGYCNQYLDQVQVPGPTHKLMVLGLAAGFKEGNDDAFAHFADVYLATYPGDNPEFAAQLQQEVAAKKALLIGSVAPDLALPTPSGDTLSISDLRGQVVLLDFWASWCRPCRMENPRVKALYESQKDQGFTILGLSLDQNKAAWVKAIEDDALPWYHVSDVKGWRSIASQTYKVSSIPHTVLLDREGRIVAKGLRGAALEEAVKTLLEAQPEE